MAIAGTLAGPQESLAILQETKVITDVDPIGVLIRKKGGRFTRRRVGEQQIQDRLRAIQPLNRQVLRIRQPVHARDVHIRFHAKIHRACLPAHDRHDKNPHHWIRASRHRIPLQLRFPGKGLKINQWKLRHHPLVHFQIRDCGRVRRPPIARENPELFGIHPVQFTFAHFLAAARRERVLLSIRNAQQPKVVVAHKAHVVPVRRNLYVIQILSSVNKYARRLALQIEPDKGMRHFKK